MWTRKADSFMGAMEWGAVASVVILLWMAGSWVVKQIRK
jgi:hypothetical protein